MVTLISLMVLVVMVVLSWSSYKQFQKALDERVLLQLTSIKRLKRVQVEEYINAEWKKFGANPANYPVIGTDSGIDQKLLDVFDAGCIEEAAFQNTSINGIYDLSTCTKNSRITLVLISKIGDSIYFHQLNHDKIQHILLERTGMGETGETYLVGNDFRLRSQSRFFPDQAPLEIKADTKGVKEALAGNNGSGIFNDYRNIPVYSAYHKLELEGLNWVMLSEMDVEEGMVPLVAMRNKLTIIFLLVSALALALALFLTGILTRPLLRMRNLLNRMSKGDYDFQVPTKYAAKEIDEMYQGLRKLKESINEAIHFSSEIGKMNLGSEYQLSSEFDQLGKSLMVMQERLREYKDQEEASQLLAKKSLILGQEKERNRLSKELHDGLGPLLTSLKLTVQRLDLESNTKKDITQVIDDTVQEVRRMTYDLMPPALADFGVGKAMSNFMEMVKKSSSIDIHYEDETKHEQTKIFSDIDVCLFRVCQELINNALKHSGGSKIAITLTEFEHAVNLFYTDNGNGFDTEAVHSGSGLRNIRERVAVFDGYVHISSSETGTQVEIEIPLHESN